MEFLNQLFDPSSKNLFPQTYVPHSPLKSNSQQNQQFHHSSPINLHHNNVISITTANIINPFQKKGIFYPQFNMREIPNNNNNDNLQDIFQFRKVRQKLNSKLKFKYMNNNKMHFIPNDLLNMKNNKKNKDIDNDLIDKNKLRNMRNINVINGFRVTNNEINSEMSPSKQFYRNEYLGNNFLRNYLKVQEKSTDFIKTDIHEEIKKSKMTKQTSQLQLNSRILDKKNKLKNSVILQKINHQKHNLQKMQHQNQTNIDILIKNQTSSQSIIHNSDHSIDKSIATTNTTQIKIPNLINIDKSNKTTIRNKKTDPHQKLPIINHLQRQLTLPPQKNLLNKVNTNPKSKTNKKQQKKNEKIQKYNIKDKPVLLYQANQLSNIKAQSFLIMQYPCRQLILVHNYRKVLQIASLTKIMTFYVTIKVSQEYSIDIENQKIQIQQYVQDITGTTAELIQGDILTVNQLLYGLMLPSGNDAAVCLADWAGGLMTGIKQNNLNNNVKRFIEQMNKMTKFLKLHDSKYGNVHGLPCPQNKSSVYDVAHLISICLQKTKKFSQIIQTKNYGFYINTIQNKSRQIIWQNTNKLLRRQGFSGVKTGITVTAGPCLASLYTFKNKKYIVVLLRTNKVSRRFKETRKILYWALKKMFDSEEGEDFERLQDLRKNRRDYDSDNSEDEQQFVYCKLGAKQLAKRNKILKYEL